MHNKPLVSVIIPAYNHEKYIDYCLNSIIDDTYPNKEIIIINDGSSDNTNDTINEWIKQHDIEIAITYISRDNKGVSTTLNEAIGLSKGKYVLPLASDDALYRNTIEQRVNILEENEDRGKLVIIGDALIMDENNNITDKSSMTINKGNKQKFKTDDGILKEMILNPSTVGAIVLINKSIYNKIGPYPEDIVVEDWIFYQRAAAIKAILFWDNIVSLYRIHSTNMSGANISTKKRLAINKSIIISVYRNICWFPSLYFKFLGIKKLIRLQLGFLKSSVKRFIIK